MTSEDDLIRFHNGDTLDNIPVVRPRPPQRAPDFPARSVLVTIAVAALVAGSAVGWALSRDGSHGTSPAAEVSASPSQAVPKAPAPTVTVWQAPSIVTASPEGVSVVQAPSTGGDPSTDYCLSYTGSSADSAVDAILLANAPAYQCDDLVFSPTPDDGEGVWKDAVPDCSRTPGARSAAVFFSEATDWYGADAYTCLLASDGA